MKGLKIRAPHTTQTIEILKALGAMPAPITLGELYLALSLGMADGQENTVSTTYKFKYYEVQKYMTLINYQWGAVTVAMNLDYYNRLPKDVQGIISGTAKEMAPWARQLLWDDEMSYLGKLKESGMNVAILNPEQISAFKEATKGGGGNPEGQDRRRDDRKSPERR